ncbi:hypothetical protein VC83_08607 [Pseudogymnoascus destructans]|uniref:SET domain-containing protein n=2 Tax=Pseudogymnoascus destructans TaxID=655981 RepID=L8FZY5_PSED2|nr:uncharacterized protein VC83_08607 [Pseudogymnoascus destructans]ELR06437.1 hypothetical protein GMDG_07962 [Pseudogymnoascus destructans 20631-21]OAF54829.1 hypothetical protein VC83_08607 [Pseudogymnoascus destructans]
MPPPELNKTRTRTLPNSTQNGLFASVPVSPQTPILRLSRPLLALLQNSALEAHCSNCLLPAPLLLPCRLCEAARFCEGCKEAHIVSRRRGMAGRHDAECATFRRVTQERGDGERLPTPVRGGAHVLARFGEEGVRERVRGMVGWRDKQVGGGKGVELQAKAVVHYSGMEMSRGRLEDALELLCVMNVNSFRITDASGDEIGIGFDPLLGMANHSCAPNASLKFDGRCAVLTALKHIEEGEEITISYIDTTLPRAARQAFLQKHYYFTCTCAACTTSSTPPFAVKPGS